MPCPCPFLFFFFRSSALILWWHCSPSAACKSISGWMIMIISNGAWKRDRVLRPARSIMLRIREAPSFTTFGVSVHLETRGHTLQGPSHAMDMCLLSMLSEWFRNKYIYVADHSVVHTLQCFQFQKTRPQRASLP
jgi:hypothetical protein